MVVMVLMAPPLHVFRLVLVLVLVLVQVMLESSGVAWLSQFCHASLAACASWWHEHP